VNQLRRKRYLNILYLACAFISRSKIHKKFTLSQFTQQP
jgi:hypothetical protein